MAIGTSGQFGWARYDCVQPRYNVLYREIETELLPLCRDQGVGVIVYNPLAGGFLTGKHSAEAPPTPGTRFTLGLGRALSRAVLAYRAVRGRDDAERLLPASRLGPGHGQRRLGAPAAGGHLGDRRRQPARSARRDAGRAELSFDDDARAAFDAIWWTIPRRPPGR